MEGWSGTRIDWNKTPRQGGGVSQPEHLICSRSSDHANFLTRFPPLRQRGSLGQLVGVAGTQGTAGCPDQTGMYQVTLSIKGGTYWALMDSGCNQTSIHQSLIQPEALDKICMVRVLCVHRDFVKYPVMLLAIQFWGQKHNVEVAVNLHLRHLLILNTNWPAFRYLLGFLCGYLLGKRESGKGGGRGRLSRDSSKG